MGGKGVNVLVWAWDYWFGVLNRGGDLTGRGATGWVLINGKWTMESGKLLDINLA